MKFGHHQSFYLRVNWLSKAIKMTQMDPRFFFDEFAFEKIGLGKNMVKSLRYWSVATSMFEEVKNDEKHLTHQLTPVGQLIAQYDRFIRLPLTTAILHIELASNIEQATTTYWYFNEFNSHIASNEEVLEALQEWVAIHHNKKVSVNTLKRDLDCLKSMYTAHMNNDDPEEIVASPLSGLQLLQESKERFIKKTPQWYDIDIDALYYALLRYCEHHKVNSVTLDEILFKPLLWGKLFNFQSYQIFQVLERLNMQSEYSLRFVQTNQLYSVYIETIQPIKFLKEAYERKVSN